MVIVLGYSNDIRFEVSALDVVYVPFVTCTCIQELETQRLGCSVISLTMVWKYDIAWQIQHIMDMVLFIQGGEEWQCSSRDY